MRVHKTTTNFRLSISVILIFFIGFVALKKQPHLSILSSGIQKTSQDTIPNWRRLLKGGHRVGPADAPVQIVEFSDFQCPYCKEMEPVLKVIRYKYPQKVAITRYNFPLHQHPQALPAAIAAECAARQGKYDKYHDLLFENQDVFASQPWDSLAKVAGIKNMKQFNGCVKKEKTLNTVNMNILLGDSLNVNMTPTLIINGIKHPGTMRENKLEQLVKKILSKKKDS